MKTAFHLESNEPSTREEFLRAEKRTRDGFEKLFGVSEIAVPVKGRLPGGKRSEMEAVFTVDDDSRSIRIRLDDKKQEEFWAEFTVSWEQLGLIKQTSVGEEDSYIDIVGDDSAKL